ncbi:MAG TPA: phosphoglucosamine mutase, partial [Candidatus Baltobacteraceae bacterium]|nr:phosphoglucosamine mutase [Candidatus Baltobacteraceae bacterium]
MSRLFGTDGVRGVANADLTPELCFRVGRAGATVLARSSDRHRPIVVGRDTRLSGTMLEAAIVAGITSVGRDVVSLGVVPTPAVACVTRREEAAAGIVISASHNPIADNGVKFFGSDGFKLSDEVESEIESLVDATDLPRPIGADVGVARLAQNLARHYYRELYESGADLRGMHVVIDGAFGAAYAIAPYALGKLGATVTEINCENDGARINVNCGATDLRQLQAAVRSRIDAGEKRVVGVAFDGDADRALFVDETGSVVSGDHVMFAIGRDMHARGELAGDAIVGT